MYFTNLQRRLMLACALFTAQTCFLITPAYAGTTVDALSLASSPIVVDCFYNSCDTYGEPTCAGDPVWIANLSVDVTDPEYADEITLSLSGAPSGMSISSYSYEIGPGYPDDFNHIYADVDPSLIPGTYTYDIVLTMTDGSSASYTVTSSFELEIACSDETACNYQPFSMCWGDDDCEYPEAGFDCDGNALITAECFYNSCTSDDEICAGSPHWIANLSVDHGDPNYAGSITLSLDGAPDGMTISSQSYDIGPGFPDDFNHIYADIPETVPPGEYTYDIVLTDENGGFTSFSLTTQISFAETTCWDSDACNYDPGSMCTDYDNCEYPEDGYDCNGNCLEDTDGDGICDSFEIAGCTSPDANNYVAEATDDDGSCTFESAAEGCSDPDAINFMSGLVSAGQGTPLVSNLSMEGLTSISDEGFFLGYTFTAQEAVFITALGALQPAGEWDNGDWMNPELIEYNGNTGEAQLGLYANSGELLASAIVAPSDNTEDGFEYSTIQAVQLEEGATYHLVLLTGNGVYFGYGNQALQQIAYSDSFAITAMRSSNTSATEMPAELPDNTNSWSLEYVFANLKFSQTEPIAEENCIYVGCTDANADNYNANASYDDGSCTVNGNALVYGCIDDSAMNFNEAATLSDDSCVFVPEIEGCTNAEAANYREEAVNDDGSCLFVGCTNPAADNYNAEADFDDGSCAIAGGVLIYGCTDEEAINYMPTANVNSDWCFYNDSCKGDFDNDGDIDALDLLSFLADFSGLCE